VTRASLGAMLCASIVAATSAHAVEPRVEDLGWLAGCWSRTDAEAGSGEQWMAAAGGTMLGMGRTVRDGRTVEYEFLVIGPAPDGRLVYRAHPSGQASAEFRLARAGDTEVVFENPAHDFPQRVGYRLERDEVTLTAWIEGTSKGETRRIPFPMQRVACDVPVTQSEAGRRASAPAATLQ
jgi:hypothetical protein